MRELIAKQGGPAEFRRRLESLGVHIPRTTIEQWSCGGRTPPPWIVALVERVMK